MSTKITIDGDFLTDILARKPIDAAPAFAKTTIRGAISALGYSSFKIEAFHTPHLFKIYLHGEAKAQLLKTPRQILPTDGDLVEVSAELVPTATDECELHVFDPNDIAQLLGDA